MPKNFLELLADTSPASMPLYPDPKGEMRASPRNKLAGMLADALSAANDYAQRSDATMPSGRANPALGMLADAVGLNSLATTAQRASYGEPLTNGMRGSKAWLKPETADVAMMAPISPRNALAALGMVGGMADSGAGKAALYVGKTKIADNLYHGTKTPDFNRVNFDAAYDNRQNMDMGDAFWLTDNFRHGSAYAGPASQGGRVKEANVFLKNPMTVDAFGEAKRIAEQIGAPAPQSWPEAANILQYAEWASDLLADATRAGNDGLIIRNSGDAPIPHDSLRLSDQLGTHVAVIKPSRARIKK